MAKKIIVLGANGMAGHVLTAGLQADAQYEVISVARTKSIIEPTVLMDVSDFVSLAKLIKKTHAAVIINCIGLLNKTAEDNPDRAILVNSYLPHFLESQTKNTKTKVILPKDARVCQQSTPSCPWKTLVQLTTTN